MSGPFTGPPQERECGQLAHIPGMGGDLCACRCSTHLMATVQILTLSERPHDPNWPQQLARAARSGRLLRIRHGCYVNPGAWTGLNDEERFLAQIEAVAITAQVEPVFYRETAGLIWGFPRPALPTAVQVAIPHGSKRSSRNGVERRSRRSSQFVVERVGEWQVIEKVQTALDLSLVYDYPWAVAVCDRLLNSAPLSGEAHPRPITKQEVAAKVELLGSAAQRRGTSRILDFADGLAMSPGESISRANIDLLGFPRPELQHAFSDSRGHCATVDFWWKEQGIVGEFDGRAKYLKPEYLNGRTAAQVVIDEKNRENRLRALGLKVVRWEWSTALNRAKLAACLREAGLRA